MLPLAPDPLAEPLLLVLGAGMVALLLTLFLLLIMRRRLAARRSQGAQAYALGEPRPAEPPGLVDPAALSAALAEAQEAGQHKRVAPLQLSLARWNLASGDTPAAADLLRQCIRSASAAGQKDTHAEARLELGDIEHADGDLASACEHWQIARSLFHELRLTDAHLAAEARMRRNGCPTDWVLTDF